MCIYIYIYIYIYPKNEYYYVSELFLMKYSAIIISIYILIIIALYIYNIYENIYFTKYTWEVMRQVTAFMF